MKTRVRIITAILLAVNIASPLKTLAMSDLQKKVMKAGVLYANTEDSVCSAGGSVVNSGVLSLTYPTIENESEVISNLTTYISSTKKPSPWIDIDKNIGQWLFNESKIRNINPLLIASIGKQENLFGTVGGDQVTKYYNYFGIKGSTPIDIPGDYAGFSSPAEGIRTFMDIVQKNTQSSDRGIYSKVVNFYDYLSMHQNGSIIYPGDLLDPSDRTGPVYDSKNNWIQGQIKPDGNKQDSYDPTMGVYISWTVTDHPNNEHDGSIYNPGVYYKNSISFINSLTGLSLSGEPSKSAGGGSYCTGSADSTGPLPPGPGGWDLPKEGSNPMVYYSQLNSGSDPSVLGYFGKLPYGPKSIQDCGCGPTTYAMVVATLTSNKIKPDEMSTWSVANNGQMPSCGSYWFWNNANAKNTFKVNSRSIPLTAESIKASLTSGKLVIISVLRFPTPTSSDDVGHISLIRKYDNGYFYLADSFADGWRDLKDVSRHAYSEADISSIVEEAWEMSAQ
jgi:hypothetical protein